MRTIIWTLLAATSAVLACKPSASDISKKFEDKNDHVAEYVEPDSLTPDGGERGGFFIKNLGEIFLPFISRSILEEPGNSKVRTKG